ncbi:MAG: hypothetical protein AW11_04049 [Candidatus Accumulibacter regalis]|uniref:Uncharacterized protein n=1 Tax=Accumulibacter regalis TaxID=522306 RepID=A0A011Q3Z4_ACCRE|nr:MAG: hypothetical protein AW11_04049 [Candidatus Accumulibacter regalis]
MAGRPLVVMAASGSRNQIVWLRRLTALALHNAVESIKISPLPTFSEERRGVHGRQLFGDSGRHELV